MTRIRRRDLVSDSSGYARATSTPLALNFNARLTTPANKQHAGEVEWCCKLGATGNLPNTGGLWATGLRADVASWHR